MKVFHKLSELGAVPGPVVIAAGVFDGLHLGHQAVLKCALETARSVAGTAVVLTFDPHPSKILRPDNASRLLTSTRHKLRLMEDFGMPAVLVLPFDRDFASVEAEDFLRALKASAPQLTRICVGQGWRFGHERRGDAGLLQRVGRDLGFETSEVPPIQIHGITVSSTRIRQLVEAGDLADVRRFLGRNYSVFGTVRKGDGLGRQIGFPTANLATHNEQFPPNGVYCVRARAGDRNLVGVANIGIRPTVQAAGERLLEVHLIAFEGDLYGHDLETEFVRFLRPERKFPDVAALRDQIARDVQSACRAEASAPDLRDGEA